MNTGESLFSIGALLLLSLTVLRVNNTILTTDSTLIDSKLGLLATSLGTSIIEEANKKAFDANTVGNPITDLSLLTAPGGLGPGAGESSPETFNDFDDFNGYTRHYTEAEIPAASFDLRCEVCYVTPTNVDGKSFSKTWHKKITVYVTSPFINGGQDTVTFSSVYSYWFFR